MSVDREAAAWSDQQRERLMRSLRRRPAPGPPFPCPYLDGREARHQTLLASTCPPGLYTGLMDLNFRRLGPLVYRPVCDACAECRQLRVPVATFQPSRSQRRCQARNRDLLDHRRTASSHGREAGPLRALPARASRRPDDGIAGGARGLPLRLGNRDDRGLLPDGGPPGRRSASRTWSRRCLSAVYCFYEPDQAAHGLGHVQRPVAAGRGAEARRGTRLSRLLRRRRSRPWSTRPASCPASCSSRTDPGSRDDPVRSVERPRRQAASNRQGPRRVGASSAFPQRAQVAAARPLLGTEARQVRRVDLAVDQLDVPAVELLDQRRRRRPSRRRARARTSTRRRRRRRATRRRAARPACSSQPGLDRMGEAAPVQLARRPRASAGVIQVPRWPGRGAAAQAPITSAKRGVERELVACPAHDVLRRLRGHVAAPRPAAPCAGRASATGSAGPAAYQGKMPCGVGEQQPLRPQVAAHREQPVLGVSSTGGKSRRSSSR